MLKFKHYIEYAFYLAVSFVLKNLPRPLGYWFMRRFGDLIFCVLSIRKQVVLANLRIAFGDSKSEFELLDLARKVYQNFAMTAMEVVILPSLPLWKFGQIAYIDGKEYLDEGRKKGKGIVMVTGHLGCWDILGFRLFLEGYPMMYVSGGFRNEIIDRTYNKIREDKGIPVLPRKYALRGVVKSLKRNELLGVVSDQDAGDNGVLVDFFGRKASTPKGAAVFALRTGAELVVVLDVPQDDRKRHRAVIRPVKTVRTGDEETDIYNITRDFTRIIEDIIRENPQHYFWLHRRWKALAAPGELSGYE